MRLSEINLSEFNLDQKKEILMKISEYFDDEVFFDLLKELKDEESIDFVLKYIFAKDPKKRENLRNELNKKKHKQFELLKELKNKTDMLNLYVEEALSVEQDKADIKNLEDNF